ncbi:hypothetical protein PN441_14760 [Spirulina major CS-329]|uniref:aspartate racemase/maleate isomerase family protein n=1 Tax=Spirulina TaxID=1154 RepID=UPI00232D9208|nr:hypothetical protein [Spirulina major]MDB9504337.1 hypothetical protein [Spirulina major CS-329]
MKEQKLVSGLSDEQQGQSLEKNPSLNLGSVSLLPVVGFITPPACLDPSPYEFTTVIQEPVLVQQTVPLLPEFDFSLESLASEPLAEHLCLCARSLKATGCSVVVQAGNPFAWANVKSEAEARRRNDRIAAATDLPTIMTPLGIVDALRSHHVKKIAVNGTYYSAAWTQLFTSFMEMCGFEVVHASNFYQQGVAQPRDPNNAEEHFRYADLANPIAEMAVLTKTSVQFIKEEVTDDYEAIVIVGTGTRTLEILCDLERIASCPVIPSDTVVYWWAAKSLHLTLSPKMGLFRDLPLIG